MNKLDGPAQEECSFLVDVFRGGRPPAADPSLVARLSPYLGSAPNAIPAVWARMQIADLANQMTHTDDPHGELPGQIKQVALDFNLMSAYTAFVAVDASRVTEGNQGTTVPVPVPVPDGVKYETTVQKRRRLTTDC